MTPNTDTEQLPDDACIIRAEQGDEFQEYVDVDGNDVPEGTPVGIEIGDEFVLFPHIFYK
jgi:hypothetical protein